MAELFNSHYFRGQGPVFIGNWASGGLVTGLTFIGDCSEVSFPATINRADIIENVSGERNVGASFKESTEYALRVVMKSVKPAHLAIASGGLSTTVAAGSEAAEAITGYHDKFSPLSHVKVSSVVVKGVGGTPTYTVTTDYIVHADEGLIETVSTGSITDGLALEIDYDYAAQHLVTVNPGDTDLQLVVPTMNLARSKKRGRLTLYKINLDPASLNAIQEGTEGASMELTGKVLFDDTRSASDRLYRWDMED